jgi:hypothetical protein
MAAAAHAQAINLIEADKPSGGWDFNNGAEFPGATGSLTLAKEGTPTLILNGNFEKGGGYVQAARTPPKVAFERLSFRMKAPGISHFTMRLVDATGQCHQINLKVQPGDDWQTVDFPLVEFFRNMGTSASIPNIAKYEKWGGANDGKWHSPCKLIAFLIGKTPTQKIVDLSLTDAQIFPTEGIMFSEGFEDEALPKHWTVQGDVKLDGDGAFKGAKSLKLSRAVEQIEQPISANGATFDAAPGPWQFTGAVRADLNSPDNSYNGVVSIQALNANGAVLDTRSVAEVFKKLEWKTFSSRIDLPRDTAKARFIVAMNKASGTFSVDELAANRMAYRVEKRIERIEISTERLGNLFLPEDKPVANIRVEALRALKENELALNWTVTDYWGAEIAAPGKVTLAEVKREKNKVSYETKIDLSALNLELYRYYELRVELPRNIEPEQEYSGFARLPLAEAKKYKPEEIPFTIRNWDNRVKDYFFLSDRLGIRTIGIWGGWESKAPYKPQAPGLEHIKAVGAKWVTTTPAANVERNGFKEYNETALREGTQNFLKEFASPDMAFIALGNEPHGKIDKVKVNVQAYKAIYEEIKKFDPNIKVVGTSVEPNETYKDVRRTIREYRALMEKYKAVKPIYSTELGLNSQGMTRHEVASELIKKCASFFAEGGESVSWFTIQYPDPQGKARGTSGDAHCVFDCKYSKYNPRLDAIAYYTMVNTLGIKKFAAEKVYADGTQAYLFQDKDGNNLLILWNETGRKEVAFPLSSKAELIRIDGSRVQLSPDAAGATLSVSREPLVLVFAQKDAGLPEALGTPAFTAPAELKPLGKGQSTSLSLVGKDLKPESLRVIAPPLWKTELTADAAGISISISAPINTSARDARVSIQKLAGESILSEVTLTIPVE